MLKKLAFLFLVLSLFSCNHSQKTGKDGGKEVNNENEGATIVFSSLQEGRGSVVATVDGKKINSGDKVAKGKVVSFIAKSNSSRYVMRKWQGASYEESSINEALLMVKDEKATYNVRADFGNIVDFLRIDSGEVKGVRVVPDITKEKLDEIIKTEQTIKVKGPSVSVVVASKEVNWDTKSFKVNGKDGYVMSYHVYKSAGLAVFDKLEIGKPFEVEFSQSVKSNEFKFKLKLIREDGQVDVPQLRLAIDEKKPEPMTATTLQELANGGKPHFYSVKDPEIEVSSTVDVIKEVILEEEGKTPQKLEPQIQTTSTGKIYFTRFYVDNIPVENAGTPREIKVTIKPKEPTKYSEVVWIFCLKQFDQTDSAEFQGKVSKGGRFIPSIIYGIGWYNSKNHELIDDYGAKSIVFTAQTIAKEASVYYQIVDLNGKPYNNSEEKLMTNNGNTSHKSEKITLFEDKPTRFKLWVVSRTGKKRNDDRGICYYIANPIYVRWGYTFTDDPSEFKKDAYSEAYDVIKINKHQVKDGKIYVSFGIWDVYKVGAEGLSSEQKPFTKMKLYEDNVYIQWYTHEVNISQLIDDNRESIEIKLPVLEGEDLCFTYKVSLCLE